MKLETFFKLVLILLGLVAFIAGLVNLKRKAWSSKGWTITAVVVGGIMFFGGIGNLMEGDSVAGPGEVKVTPEVFKKIKEGITYEKMVEKIGGEPKKEREVDGTSTVIYEYDGENGVEEDSSVTFYFRDGKLDEKAEYGLLTKIESSKDSKQEQKPVDESVDADTGDKPEISEHAKKMAVDFITDDPLVKDAHIEVEGDKVTIAIVVNAAMNEERAKEVGDNFVRFLNTMVDGTEPATKHYLGSLWDHYDLHVGVGTGPDHFIAQGAKVTTAKRITW